MMKHILGILIFCIIAVNISGLQSENNTIPESMEYEVLKYNWVDSVSQSLTLEQKIAQFFMPGIYPTQGNASKNHIKNLIEKYQIGGVIFFKGHPSTYVDWTNEIESVSPIPLFTAVDGEWGINMRVDSTIQYPRQLTLGAIQNNDLIFSMGKQIGKECLSLGININFAPVMDVNNNINNPVINDRSFGEDKYNVALKSLSYAQGMQRVGIMAVGKHFPGHGDTDTDSHKDLPIIPHSFERLYSLELYPFKVAIQNHVMGMMVAHLNIPALDDTENLASSLSKKVVQNLLIDDLGFKGLVFTDALNMQGVSKYFEPGEVDKIAFLAGNDILLVSEDVGKGIEQIKKAVENKEITEEYIDVRLRKLLAFKYQLGLHQTPVVEKTKSLSALQSDDANQLNADLFKAAITIAENNKRLIPLKIGQQENTASLSIGSGKITSFQKQATNYGVKGSFYVNNGLSENDKNAVIQKLDTYDRIVISVHNMSRWKSKNYGFTNSELALIKDLSQEKEVILVLFGSPYSLIHFQENKNIIVAYEDNAYTEKYAADALFGTINVDGKLPVSIGKYKVNSGFSIKKNELILQYAMPNEVGLDQTKLDSIDYFAEKAIDIAATPGCQILVAKDGKIVYEKGFGHYTYDGIQDVTPQTVYDLASITKVAATTLSVMKLFEDGEIDLSQSLDYYLDDLKRTTVGGLIIKDILAHQSGLPAWIPFYTATIEDSVYNNWYSVDSNAAYCVKVADDLFMCKDSVDFIWKTIEGVTIKEDPDYRYSDLGFYLMMKVIEKIKGQTLDTYVSETFFQPMGLNKIGYLPMNRLGLGNIPPTEKDTIFRKQEVKGYVHDPGAAMLGGVCGHAGLFSNATDLAAIFQMLLNGGFYNGKQFLQESTISYFNTLYYEDNRRGLGFDKPVLVDEKTGKRKGGPTYEFVSDACFGHTGFTGTCVWADPEYDLIYVFLSNRTYPFATSNILAKENIRTDIQGVIYRSMQR